MDMKALRLLVGAALSLSGSLTVVSAAGAAPLKTWDTIINRPSRFKVLKAFNSEAVLDNETGLVWQRDAGALNIGGCINPFHWAGAVECCSAAIIGGRGGWRLRSITEFYSIIDVTQSNPALPLGHPFVNVQNKIYLNSSEAPSNAATPDLSATNVINLADGTQVDGLNKTSMRNYWCVRGPGSN